MPILLAALAIPVLIYGLFKYREKRNLYWWLLVVLAVLLVPIALLFLAAAVLG